MNGGKVYGGAVNGGAAGGETKALLDWLELELTAARRETERLRSKLVLSEGKRRQAEQLAHSEAALRLDLGRAYAARIRHHETQARAAAELLEAAHIHARKLAREVGMLRRSIDEGAAGVSFAARGQRASPPGPASSSPPGRDSFGPEPGTLAPDRLAAALERLREEHPPPVQEPGPFDAIPSEPATAAAPGWLLRALKRLLREEPETVAGS